MFLKLALTWLVAVISFFIFYSCSDSTSPHEDSPGYMVLNVGDIRQIISTKDSTTELWTITDTTKRVDGLKVFVGKRIYGTSDTALITSFYALKDGYFIATELDTVKDEPHYTKVNPFREQRLAKVYPHNGDTWTPILGGNVNHKVTAKYTGKKIIGAINFENVYGFYFSYPAITVFYAKETGYIATSDSEDSISHITSYLKINGREYGKLYPQKALTNINEGPGLTVNKSVTVYGFFGEKINR